MRHRVRQGRPIVLKRTAEYGFSKTKSHHPTPKRRQAPHNSYPLRGAEHKHWAETLNITPFFLKCVINGSIFFLTFHLHTHACKILLILYQSIGSFRVNSNSDSQVSVSNIAQIIPKITLVSIMKACKILGCNSEYCWRYIQPVKLSVLYFVVSGLCARLS